jgi:glycosyltransferase involved in cell wall biosynthesis
LLRGLEARGVDVLALSIDMRRDTLPAPPADLPLEVLRVPYPSRVRDRTQQLVRPFAAIARGPFADLVQARSGDADVVHLVELGAAALIKRVDRPTLVQFHCLTKRDREIRPPWRSEGRIALELLRAERRACRQASWLLANSEEVADGLARAAPHAHVAVAPLALDPAYYPAPAALEQPVAGMIGLADWPPTANAVERLLTHVWPRVLERQPDARLLLAGRSMERERFAHLPDLSGVEWRGTVPSATAFLRELSVLLYPLGRGSGAKVKVLESLALGIPIVTTPDGAEGIGGPGGIAVETDDDRLAGAAVELLADPLLRRAAGAAALRTFTEHHAPAVAAAPVVELYERMVA